MPNQYSDIETIKDCLYTRRKEFKKFENITEEDIERIKKLVELKGHTNKKNQNTYLKRVFNDYNHVLLYLTNNKIHFDTDLICELQKSATPPTVLCSMYSLEYYTKKMLQTQGFHSYVCLRAKRERNGI